MKTKNHEFEVREHLHQLGKKYGITLLEYAQHIGFNSVDEFQKWCIDNNRIELKSNNQKNVESN